ncbi:MAG: MerR family transcriptional regulator [Solirubrobacterales bacterium]
MAADQPQAQGLYMISVAATLAGVHPQTLRIYEQRRLLRPARTPKGTRLYSDENLKTLRRIQELTDEGMSLAGVERVFRLEAQLARAQRRINALERTLEQTRAEAIAEVERVHRSYRAEIVPYVPPRTALIRRQPAPKQAMARPRHERPTRIPVTRPDDGHSPAAEQEDKEI